MLCAMRILIVDDDIVAQSVMSAMLEEAGYDVRAASDGREALSALLSAAWQPDLMVLDFVLPEFDGADVLEALKALQGPRRIPVVIITGRVEAVPQAVRRQTPVVSKSPGLPGLLEAIEVAAGMRKPRTVLHELSL
jgi:CheY-like chemotaxis protein